jgi:AAA domain
MITEHSSNIISLDQRVTDFGPDPTWDEHQRVNGAAFNPLPIGPALKITAYRDCGVAAAKDWIIKGVIARGETSAWVAPPGAGKSALMAEIAVSCAAQLDWRGYKAKNACGVVILALERADLYKRRLYAYQLRDGLRDLPIAVAGSVIDLMTPNCVGLIGATIREAGQLLRCPVGLIIVDTYNKAIAAGGGDEDKARDQNRVAANLRRVQEQCGVHIALVSHTGKDETRGARGSNAHLGDVDLMVQISGDAVKVANIVKGNDQVERCLAQFRLQPYELGIDEDGDAITTAIVGAEQINGEPVKKAKRVLAVQAELARRALAEVLAELGKQSIHVPAGLKGVPEEAWREECYRRGIGGPEKDAMRKAFGRAKDKLAVHGISGERDGIVWLA